MVQTQKTGLYNDYKKVTGLLQSKQNKVTALQQVKRKAWGKAPRQEADWELRSKEHTEED